MRLVVKEDGPEFTPQSVAKNTVVSVDRAAIGSAGHDLEIKMGLLHLVVRILPRNR